MECTLSNYAYIIVSYIYWHTWPPHKVDKFINMNANIASLGSHSLAYM